MTRLWTRKDGQSQLMLRRWKYAGLGDVINVVFKLQCSMEDESQNLSVQTLDLGGGGLRSCQ